MTAVVAYLALTVTILAMLLGHQGQDWPLSGAWRAARAVLGSGRPLRARLPAERASRAPGFTRAPEQRTEPHTPPWARTDKDTP